MGNKPKSTPLGWKSHSEFWESHGTLFVLRKGGGLSIVLGSHENLALDGKARGQKGSETLRQAQVCCAAASLQVV